MRTRILVALSLLTAAAVACGDVATSSPGSTGTGTSATPTTAGAGTAGSAANGSSGSTTSAGSNPTTGTTGTTGTTAPTTGPTSGCSTSNQCQGPGGPGGHCQAPGIDDTGCGGPSDYVTGTCAADGDCADAGPAPQICVVDPCARIYGSDDDTPVHRCTYGCTADDDCNVGSSNGNKAAITCQAGHCVAPVCSTAADCLPNFACSGGSCTRTTCATDSQCAGFCVDGACSSVAGMCEPDAG